MTNDEIIEVVQAHKEGKKIQWVGRFEADKDINWRYDPNPKWNFEHLIYRVAPEPRKPRELRLVYKGSGTWQEWMGEPGPCSAKSILFREIVSAGGIGTTSGEPTVIWSTVKTSTKLVHAVEVLEEPFDANKIPSKIYCP